MDKPRSSAPASEGQIVLDGQTISYTIRHSDRAKHVRLLMRPQIGLIIVVPRRRRITVEATNRILYEKRDWVLANLERIRQYESPPAVGNGSEVPFIGGKLLLEVRRGSERNTAQLVDGRLLVCLSRIPEPGPVVAAWYRFQTRRLVTIHAGAYSKKMGLRYNRVGVRTQRTRWGSCSSKGNLSFNWRLAMLPEPVIEYVVIHELAHLKVMNHSPKFWAVVRQYCPAYEERRRWLTKHGREYLAIALD